MLNNSENLYDFEEENSEVESEENSEVESEEDSEEGSEEGSEEESEEDSEEENFWDSLETNSDEKITNLEGYLRSDEFANEVSLSDSADYSGYFENLQSIGILMTGVILGASICLSFILGFKKNE